MTASSLTAGLGLGALGFAAYALGYLTRFRRVTTAAEARARRDNARSEQTFKRWCKRHEVSVQWLAHWNGERDMPFSGGVLHLCDTPRTIEGAAKNAKGWLELWADETAHPPRKGTAGYNYTRQRRGKYVPSGCPVRYGSSKRGKRERPWANEFNASLLGLLTAPAPPRDTLFETKLVGFDPEVVGAVDTKTVHELFKSEIEPIVLKPEEK